MERKGRELRLVIFIEYVAIHYIDMLHVNVILC